MTYNIETLNPVFDLKQKEKCTLNQTREVELNPDTNDDAKRQWTNRGSNAGINSKYKVLRLCKWLLWLNLKTKKILQRRLVYIFTAYPIILIKEVANSAECRLSHYVSCKFKFILLKYIRKI